MSSYVEKSFMNEKIRFPSLQERALSHTADQYFSKKCIKILQRVMWKIMRLLKLGTKVSTDKNMDMLELHKAFSIKS